MPPVTPSTPSVVAAPLRPPYLTGAGGAEVDPVLGDLRVLGACRKNQVKGNLIASRGRFLHEEYGEDVVRTVAASLSPKARDYLLDPPLAFAWCDYEPLMEVDYFIVVKAMGGMVEQMKQFGIKIAGYDLPIAYRVLFKVGSPAFVAGRLPLAYRTYLRPGEVEVNVRADAKEAALRLAGAVFPRYMCEYGIAGWMRAALTMSGGANATSRHATCLHRGDPACTWELSWR